MHSKGYTGQQKIALREWEYNEENLIYHERIMSKLTESDFQENGHNEMTAYDLTMYLRGDLFVLVDCLFGFTYTNPNRDILRVEAFLMSFMSFFQK